MIRLQGIVVRQNEKLQRNRRTQGWTEGHIVGQKATWVNRRTHGWTEGHNIKKQFFQPINFSIQFFKYFFQQFSSILIVVTILKISIKSVEGCLRKLRKKVTRNGHLLISIQIPIPFGTIHNASKIQLKQQQQQENKILF